MWSQSGPCSHRFSAASRISAGSSGRCRSTSRPLQEHQPIGQVADPDRQTAVDRVRAELTQHGEDRVRVGEGQLLDEVVLLMLETALRRGPVLVSVETPRVLHQGAVHAREPTVR